MEEPIKTNIKFKNEIQLYWWNILNDNNGNENNEVIVKLKANTRECERFTFSGVRKIDEPELGK